MSSHFRNSAALATIGVLCGMLGACGKTPNTQASTAVEQGGPASTAVSGLFPGGGSPPAADARDAQFDNNPTAIAAGKRYYSWYNCNGCHFNGGGGIGPALMDDQWKYGGRLDQIYASIYQGRPNGMPSWAGKIPDAQIWQIAAYVRSMSQPNAAVGSSKGSEKATTPTPPPGPVTEQTEPQPQTVSGDSNSQ